MSSHPRPSRLALEVLRRGAWAPSAVFGVHLLLSLGLRLYGRVEWLDDVVHFVGGAAIALFFARGLAVLVEHDVLARNPPWFDVVLVLALVSSAAVLWEFAEFALGRLALAPVSTMTPDPVSDLFFGLVGGATFLAAQRRRPPSSRGA